MIYATKEHKEYIKDRKPDYQNDQHFYWIYGEDIIDVLIEGKVRFVFLHKKLSTP